MIKPKRRAGSSPSPAKGDGDEWVTALAKDCGVDLAPHAAELRRLGRARVGALSVKALRREAGVGPYGHRVRIRAVLAGPGAPPPPIVLRF